MNQLPIPNAENLSWSELIRVDPKQIFKVLCCRRSISPELVENSVEMVRALPYDLYLLTKILGIEVDFLVLSK